MIKHFCDLCGKEIPLKSAIIQYIPVSDLPPNQYDICDECDVAFAHFIHKFKLREARYNK